MLQSLACVLAGERLITMQEKASYQHFISYILWETFCDHSVGKEQDNN